MRWFSGDETWKGPKSPEITRTEVPVGSVCWSCGKPIFATDCGLLVGIDCVDLYSALATPDSPVPVALDGEAFGVHHLKCFLSMLDSTVWSKRLGVKEPEDPSGQPGPKPGDAP